jgi:hypothetical protein
MNDFLFVLLSGFLLTAGVFFALFIILDSLLKSMLSKQFKHHDVFRFVGLIVAWLSTLPCSIWLINSSLLKNLVWGHAGEALFLAFLPSSIVLFVIFVRYINRSK